MRRGHAGIGGWRNENPRHFRPRSGGPPLFRPNRNYPLQDTLRFPPPGPRPLRGQFINRPPLLNTPPPDIHDRSKFRLDNRSTHQYRPQDRNHHQGPRSFFPIFDRMRHDKDQGNQYKDKSYYDYSKNDPWHINSMGDVDDRQLAIPPNNPERYGIHPLSPWSHPSDNKRQYFEDKTIHKPYRHNDTTEANSKIPVVEYSGHRPPSSDHYGGNPSSTLDNSNSFSRSVDDTVDIIRKRLQNRGEPHETLEDQRNDNIDIDDGVADSISSNYQEIQQNQPVKRRVQKQKQNVEANCDKMKNKIVHELFKMDKDKIHKLMDNPSSSSKFEYALNSFITESQNSLNRHLRSVAEKSLCTSEEFVHNDNNTIYEDTFMKQMQGILDPQDTVLLEDIKPLVLAELSKVLQLNEYDQPFQITGDQGNYQTINEQQNLDLYDSYNFEDFPQSHYYDQSQSPSPQKVYGNYENPKTENDDYSNFECIQPEQPKPKPLFERRTTKESTEICSERNPISIPETQSSINTPNKSEQDNLFSMKRRHSRRSLENKLHEEIEPPVPLFDSNTEQLSDDEDPFAELDRQYHVAVDPNFIETYGSPQPSTPNRIITPNTAKSPNTQYEANIKIRRPSQDTDSLKQEIDDQLFNIANSPLKLSLMNTEIPRTKKPASSSSFQVKQELPPTSINIPSDNCERSAPLINIKQESSIDEDKHTESAENFNTPVKTSLPSNTRKRSVDQKPSHRKEKRKKSDSSQSDSSNQIMNKNIIINVNDCSSKDTEKCTEAAKSIFNLYFSKDDTAKNTKQIKSVDKTDKFVKRKETQKTNEKEGEKEHKKRQRSVSSSHSTVSPKEEREKRNNVNNNSQTNKSESKTKLQSIDMFTEQPRKISNSKVHQAHRNMTACPNTPVIEKTTSQHTKPVKICNKKVSTKHVTTKVFQKTHTKETQTFENKSVSSRFCQTEKKRMINRWVQTNPDSFERTGIQATDAFERMKEIDLEIQNLLQEKFKLYNCMKSSDPCSSTIQGLGVTVVNVTPDAETQENDDNEVEVLSADDIIEDFASIPVEELEQIALESVQHQNDNKKGKKKNRRQKLLEDERASSSSPTTRRSTKKLKTPNISLLEQIITDDRPLEEIISLDDLETTPGKNRKQKRVTNVPKRKGDKKTKMVKPSISRTDYIIKECSVMLTREDFSKYLKPKTEAADVVIEEVPITVDCVEEVITLEEPSNIVEETVGNDLHFDMLDVSEDIVIGDNCEVKSNDDKDVERTEMAATEEIILDNSQSSEPVPSDAGQAEDVCKMYDYSTDESLRRDTVTVTGHADAVLAIECIENSFIAACLDGNVYHFSNDGQLIATLRGSNLAVTCLTIVKEKYGTTVYTGSLDSRIRYYDLETGLEKGLECNVLSPIQTMDRAWDTIFVGTRTGFVLQFECKNNMLIPVSTVKFSDQSILALRAMKEGPRKVLLVAARSEDVTIKDAQTGLLLRTLQGPKMTVYTLLYEDGKIYCGTSSHQIHVFDYASGSHVGAHEGGKGAVCLRATGGLVFAGCYDGCVYIFREGSPRPRAQLRGPGLMLLSLCVQGSRLIAGYKDRSLYIWKIPVSILQEMIL